jgi:hypothetical protein
VAGPSAGFVPETQRRERLDTVAGLEATVVRFLAAYLTGDGEVERYTAPDARIRPVTPAPFTTVEVTYAGVERPPDGSLAATVNVDGTSPSGGSLAVSYLLLVVERDGRFEVARVLPPLPAIPQLELGGST